MAQKCAFKSPGVILSRDIVELGHLPLRLLFVVYGVVLSLEELGHVEPNTHQNHRHDVVQDPSHADSPSSKTLCVSA
jgi:hypothetical protein